MKRKGAPAGAPFTAMGSSPAHGGGLLLKDADTLEEGDRFLQSLVDGHEAVLMLDGQDSVVAAEAEVGDQVSPVGLAVAVAHGAEDPGAVQLVGVVLGVQHAVGGGVVLVDLGVLGVDVVDGALQLADGGHGIHALPDQVGGIEVGANDRSYCLAQTEQGSGVVDAEAGVHLKGDVGDVVGQGEGTRLLPVGNDLLIPLPVQDGEKILGPGAGDPVGVLGALVVAGAAREGDDGIHAHLLGQQDRVAEVGVEGRGDGRVGMEGVAVAGQRAHLHVVLLQGGDEFIVLGGVGQQLGGVAVSLAGVTARAQLYGVDAQTGQNLQGLVKGLGAVQVG